MSEPAHERYIRYADEPPIEVEGEGDIDNRFVRLKVRLKDGEIEVPLTSEEAEELADELMRAAGRFVR